MNSFVRESVLGGILLILTLGCGSGVPSTVDDFDKDTSDSENGTVDPSDTSNTPNDTSADTSIDTADTSITIIDTDYDTNWGGPGPCQITTCQGHEYDCGDCADNDSDGLKDSRDPDCLGPCDNNEAGFQLDIPGGDVRKCNFECYFDQDGGAGNDRCEWNHLCDTDHTPGANITDTDNPTCDPSDTPPSFDECNALWTEQDTDCGNICRPLVPNGCDCWGCCLLEGAYRWIGTPGCTLANIAACDLCTPVPSCDNSCQHCELCLGKTELPPDCDTDVGQICDDGRQQCGQPGDDPCPADEYCVTGCCIYSGPI